MSRRLAEFTNNRLQSRRPLVVRHKRRSGRLVGPDAALQLVTTCLNEMWPDAEQRENLIARKALLEECRNNPIAQAREQQRCDSDIHYYTRFYGWTFDPRARQGKWKPFIPFSRQEEYLDWLNVRYDEQQDGVVEKSRDMGVSWLCIVWSSWKWLFERGFTAIFVSNLLRNVDQLEDPKSLFQKFRDTLRYLPTWLLPKGLKLSRILRIKNRFHNPENGATITGEGGTEAGRSGRASVVFIDEAAHVEQAERVEASLSQTTDCRIWVSTPRGMGNLFAQKVHDGKLPVFRLHWLEDPRKNNYTIVMGPDQKPHKWYPWYEEQKRRLSPLTVAQEIDIDYSGSIEDTLFPSAWLRAAQAMEFDARKYSRPRAGLDVADDGAAECSLAIALGPIVEVPITWTNVNTTLSARRVIRICKERNVYRLTFDAGGVGAGVHGEIKSGGLLDDGDSLEVYADKWGEKPSGLKWANGRRSAEMFELAKDEEHWIVRTRLKKTYEHWLWLQGDVNGIEHDEADLIQLPTGNKATKLIRQMSSLTFEERENGKIRIESKKSLRTRNIPSPDQSDSVVLLFAPSREKRKVVPSHSQEVYI